MFRETLTDLARSHNLIAQFQAPRC
jgi:hypothetical protein